MKKFLSLLFILSVICIFGIVCKNDPVSSTPQDPDTPHDPDPPSELTVPDKDGNVYHTVKIGNQIWTTENLRTTKYNNGSLISNISDTLEWSTTRSGAYCSYKNQTDTDSIKTFGLLYNWYAVSTGRLAPEGWHVPTIYEWDTLFNYLKNNGYNWNDDTIKYKCAKAVSSNSHWKLSTIPGAIGNDLSTNNRSGFSAQPAGLRYTSGDFGSGVFGNRGLYTHFWSSSTAPASYIHSIFLSFERDSISFHNQARNRGFSVRIVKND
ncbi:MAG TPA: fibrobacter succinogenes major paralogous domain-containing protein [Chitinispirillaceae bacterium]|nr:fibrobacter succinogenes major paralogous domain-containing protein [Chitinispirillaceae bacterium]